MENLPKAQKTQRIRISSDDQVLEATSEAGGERFAREIAYLEHYVPKVGRILDMRAIRFGVIEDADDQTAFRFTGKDGEIEGFVSGASHPLGDIVSGKAWGDVGSEP